MWTVEVCALWGGCEEGVLENRLDEGSVLKVKVKDKGKSGGTWRWDPCHCQEEQGG